MLTLGQGREEGERGRERERRREGGGRNERGQINRHCKHSL